MAKRRRKEEQVVSLFPFLSILACLIGVLTLMITALALGQMDQGVIQRAKDYQAVKAKIEEDKKETVDVKDLVAKADAIREQIKRALDELKRLQAQKKQVENKDDANIKLLAESNRLRNRIEELQPELKKLQKLLKKLQEELRQRKDRPTESEVHIQPGGSGVNLTPHFVECTPQGIVIHEGAEPTSVRRADLRNSQLFKKLLEQVAAKAKTDRIVFLLRSDGVASYNTARSVARIERAPNGKLAVVGQGKIDLSLFQKN